MGTQATDWGAHLPGGALGLCAQVSGGSSECALTWASGVCWGCLSGVHSPQTEGVGAQEARAAAQNSLNSH